MLDLSTLGRELRRRRRELRIPSAELARRIGVSQTYVWLIEQARPRKSGEPSRPGEDVLERWTVALGMNVDEARHIRELAGYFSSDLLRDHAATRMSPPSTVRSSAPVARATSENAYANEQYAGARSELAPHMRALRQWSGAARGDQNEATIARRIADLLALAEQEGRTDEAAGLLDSFLQWLEFHLRRETT